MSQLIPTGLSATLITTLLCSGIPVSAGAVPPLSDSPLSESERLPQSQITKITSTNLTTNGGVNTAIAQPSNSTNAQDLLAQDGSVLQKDTPDPVQPVAAASTPIAPTARWTFSTEALFLKRNLPNVDTTADAATQETFGTSALDFNTDLGARFTIGYQANPKDSVEFSYFGLHDWSDTATFTSSNAPTEENLQPTFKAQPFANTDDQPEDFSQASQHRLDYESRLTSLELNYQRRLNPIQQKSSIALVAGVRYFNIDEAFKLTSFDGGTAEGGNIGRYKINTDNDLIGLQVGLKSRLQVSRNFALGLTAKAGLLLNFSSAEGRLVNDGAVRSVFRDRDRATGVSPMVELGAMAMLDISPNFTFKAGYQFLYLGGIVTAPGQYADASNFPLGARDRDSVIYHGPFVGFDFRF